MPLCSDHLQCAVEQHQQWLERLEAAAQADLTRPHPKYKHRHQAHFIAISQPGAGGWLDRHVTEGKKSPRRNEGGFSLGTGQ